MDLWLQIKELEASEVCEIMYVEFPLRNSNTLFSLSAHALIHIF